jgi:hypothetical protein
MLLLAHALCSNRKLFVLVGRRCRGVVLIEIDEVQFGSRFQFRIWNKGECYTGYYQDKEKQKITVLSTLNDKVNKSSILRAEFYFTCDFRVRHYQAKIKKTELNTFLYAILMCLFEEIAL